MKKKKQVISLKKVGNEQPERTDYRKTSLSRKQKIFLFFEGVVLAAGIDYLFFKRGFMLIPLAIIIPFWIRMRAEKIRDKRQKELYYSFRDMLNGLSMSLRAGYSIENAFFETEKNLRRLQGESDLTREIAWINQEIQLNRPVEKLFADFAIRSGIEDIQSFSAVFSSIRRTGGSLSDTIRSTARVIEEKIDVEREIDSAIAAKKLEYKIMIMMPALIILYMNLTSPGYLGFFYQNTLGFVVMLLCLLGYGAAIYAGGRIVDIKV